MRRVTVTVPDELEHELERYIERQATAPSVTTIVQVALREFLAAQALRERHYERATRPFELEPLPERDEAGEADVSRNHDRYFGEVT
jgi:Arc/MetJ-type ribon-helix-helix transcriptional regulator